MLGIGILVLIGFVILSRITRIIRYLNVKIEEWKNRVEKLEEDDTDK